MKPTITAVLSGLVMTVAACAPSTAADMMPKDGAQPTPETTGAAPSGPLPSMDSPAVADAAPPPIELKEDLVDANPKGLAAKLSPLLKVEVRSNLGGLRKVTLKAGKWTATDLLDEVAVQLQCGWRQEFRLDPRTRAEAGTAERTSEKKAASTQPLPSPGRVTCFAPLLSFSRIVEVVRGNTGCRVVLPDRIPTSRHKVAWRDVPMEDALADLARAGNFTVVRVVVLEELATMAKAQQQDGDQVAADAEVRKAEASGWLLAAYGMDPTGPEFPWENVDLESLAMSAAPTLDLIPAELIGAFEQLRGEASTRAAQETLPKEDAPIPPPDNTPVG